MYQYLMQMKLFMPSEYDITWDKVHVAGIG